MANRPQLTHEQVVAYLRGEIENEQRAHLRNLKETDPVVQLFVDFVDTLKSQAISRELPNGDQASYSFAEIDDLLASYFAGTLQPEEMQNILDRLAFSADFFRRLLIKFEQATPQLVLGEVPEIAQIPVRSDDEILAEIVEHVKRKPASTIAGSISQLFHQIFDSLQGARDFFWGGPRYAWLLVLLLLGSTATWLAYENFIKGEPFDYYVYDDRVPYEYDASSLREPATGEKDPRWNTFINQFMLGLSDYSIRDYASAITLFEQAEAALPEIADSAAALWQRDLNFYWGLSHLSFSIDSKLPPTDRAKQQHAAVQRLRRADALVRERHLEDSDRETYFLGLAHGLGGQPDSAIVQLHMIEPGSRFYKDSAKLISKWSQ